MVFPLQFHWWLSCCLPRRLIRLQQVVARRMWRSSPCWAPAEPMPWEHPMECHGKPAILCPCLIEIKRATNRCMSWSHDDADVMMNHDDKSWWWIMRMMDHDSRYHEGYQKSRIITSWICIDIRMRIYIYIYTYHPLPWLICTYVIIDTVSLRWGFDSSTTHRTRRPKESWSTGEPFGFFFLRGGCLNNGYVPVMTSHWLRVTGNVWEPHQQKNLTKWMRVNHGDHGGCLLMKSNRNCVTQLFHQLHRCKSTSEF